jgi:hypothetical protein
MSDTTERLSTYDLAHLVQHLESGGMAAQVNALLARQTQRDGASLAT